MDVIDRLRPVNALFDRIERLPVPVVCCHPRLLPRRRARAGPRLPLPHRHPRRRHPLGFPEVKLGIFPGFNGTARSIRQAGAAAAMQAMLTAQMLSASAARGIGLVDELVDSPGDAPWAARKAVLRKRKSKPAGFAKALLTMWPARGLLAKQMRQETEKKVREDHYPAPFRLIDLFETLRRRLGGHEGAPRRARSRR